MKYNLLHFFTVNIKNILLRIVYFSAGITIAAVFVFIYLMNNRPDLNTWHTSYLDEEFTIEKQAEITSFDAYLALEDKLFRQLQTDIYSQHSTLPPTELNRFKSGSLADPTSYPKNWNRSFILKPKQPRGGILLLHGLSDSPYSLRNLAQELYRQGYYVLGLRMPGHGTAPSGLVHASWQDMAAAVKLAAYHVDKLIGTQLPMYVIGYSMGAAQSVNYALDALQDNTLRQPDAMVLISPAIGVSGVAALAVWQSRLSILPGLDKLAWNSIGPEYDPYKYNSFAVNAGDQMYRMTLEIGKKLSTLQTSDGTHNFPRTLALMSLVDATVSVPAVMTHLFDRLSNTGNEFMVFDLNRLETFTLFLKNDPVADYRVILKRSKPNFNFTFFTNESPESDSVVARRWSKSGVSLKTEQTGMAWPDHVYSLSHVALPFPPTDSLYGSEPKNDEGLHIGQLVTKGEKGVFNISASDMLRLRYNPFYANMQQKIIGFIADRPAE